MSSSTHVPLLSDVFEVLQEAARSAAATGRALYGPQAMKALRTQYPDLDIRAYGYKKLIELLRAGHDAGRFTLVTVDGHPQVTPAPTAPPRRPMEQGRLRPDLWTTLVTWDTGLRYWDRKNRRAVFVPTTEDGTPEWEAAPSKYVRIDPVPMQKHLEWMVDFANDQSESAQQRLLDSLRGSAPGAFKSCLNELGLASAWRTRLRQRVTEHAAEWATRAQLPPASILDPTPRSTPKTTHPPAGAAAVEVHTEVSSEEARLRTRLHQVIDQMSMSKLSQIQVPASYLLEH